MNLFIFFTSFSGSCLALYGNTTNFLHGDFLKIVFIEYIFFSAPLPSSPFSFHPLPLHGDFIFFKFMEFAFEFKKFFGIFAFYGQYHIIYKHEPFHLFLQSLNDFYFFSCFISALPLCRSWGMNSGLHVSGRCLYLPHRS